MTSSTAAGAGLRKDAAANQARIVRAARQVFSEQGVDVALSEVAKRAGVGLATVTRRFSRTTLVEAVLSSRTEEHLQLLDDALAEPATESLAYYLEELCSRQVDDQSVCHALTLSLPDSPDVTEHRAAIRAAQTRLIERASGAGVLREGVTPEDFLLIFQGVSGVIASTRATSPGSWRRLLSVVMAGLAPRAGAVDLPPAPAAEDLVEQLTPPRRGRKASPVGA